MSIVSNAMDCVGRNNLWNIGLIPYFINRDFCLPNMEKLCHMISDINDYFWSSSGYWYKSSMINESCDEQMCFTINHVT